MQFTGYFLNREVSISPVNKSLPIFHGLSFQATLNFSNIEMLAEMKNYLGFLIPKVTISSSINLLLFLKSAVITV